MRITIDTESARVRVIKDIDVAAVSQLEGFNGIGKSSAIRLLLVATGRTAYIDNQRAWDSFRENVGRGTVRISEIDGAGYVQWQFDTRTWPENAHTVTDEWFTEVLIDDRKASLAEATALVTIDRLSGDQAIVATFAAELLQVRDAVGATFAQIDASSRDSSSLSSQAQHLLEDLLALTRRVSPEEVQRVDESVSICSQQQQLAQELAATATDRSELLLEAGRLSDGLRELAEVAPDVETRLEAAETEVRVVAEQRAAVEKQLESALQAAAVGDQVRDELAKAERNRDRNQIKHNAVSEQLAEELESLGLSPSAADLEVRRDALVRKRLGLVSTLSELDTAPRTVALARDVEESLRRDATLQGQQIVPEAYARDGSVRSLAEAIHARAESLRAVPKNAEQSKLTGLLADVDRRLTAIESVSALLGERDRLARLVDQHARRADELADAGGSEAVQALEALRIEQREIEDRYTAAISQRARLRQQLSAIYAAGSAEAQESRLRSLLAQLDIVSRESLADEIVRGIADAEAAQAKAESASMQLEKALSERDEVYSRTRAAAASLEMDAQFAWAKKQSFGAGWSSEHLDPEDVSAIAQRVEKLHHRADRASRRLEQLPRNLLAVRGALETVASRLRSPAKEPQRDDAELFVGAITEWAADHFAEYFRWETNRINLLGSNAHDIEVDVVAGNVTWSVGEERLWRPLDAFSSGQQAFAYARARLDALDGGEATTRNRLICLDEFGAFMDGNRRADLLRFLRERAASYPFDSVLLILPLRQGFEDLVARALGDERKRLERLQHQLVERGYFIEDVSK